MKNTIIVICILLCLLTIGCRGFRSKARWDDNRKNWSELMRAIYYNQNWKVTQLIDSDVDILYSIDDGYFNLSAMNVAIRSNNEVAVLELLKTEKIQDKSKYLNLACLTNSNFQIIKYLCEFGANINFIDENGYNSIMYATSFCTVDVMKYLIGLGADVNSGLRPGDGATSLILAIYNNDIEKIKILLEAGANTKYINNNGETIYNLAKKYLNEIDNIDREKILELLK